MKPHPLTYPQRLKAQLRQATPMLILSFLAFLVGSIAIILQTSSGLFLKLNTIHNPIADVFFHYYTYMGDGLMFTFVALVIIAHFRTQWYFLTMLAGTLGTLVVTQGLKRLVFDEALRPLAYFGELGIPIRLVEGVTVHHHNTFPSGHTVSAFAMFTLLSLVTKDKRWQILYFIGALLAGYSRIYLSQHFPADVVAGILAGCLIALLAGSIWLPRPTKD
jgi:membrane-associated phospholipid phosphatase